MKLPELPTYYYLDHFSEMLSFVETTYSAVLDAEHHAFIRQFRTLSADEQCLFVRMTNRRRHVFCPAQFKYAEIKDVTAAIARLLAKNCLRPIVEADYAAWLTILKKPTLIDIAHASGCDEVRASWNKPRLLDHFLERIPFAAAAIHGQASSFIAMANTGPLEFLLYLYFGKTREDLKSFALRDLGILRVNDAAQFKARFEDPAEARASFFIPGCLTASRYRHRPYLTLLLKISSADQPMEVTMRAFCERAPHYRSDYFSKGRRTHRGR